MFSQSSLFESCTSQSAESLKFQTLELFIPLAISMILSASIGIVDMHIAGFLGSKAQAAVGLADQLLFCIIVFGSGLSSACSSVLSRAVGAGDFNACWGYVQSSLLAALVVGIASSLIGVCFAKPMMLLLGFDLSIQSVAIPYAIYNSLANTPFVISLCLSAIFRALGRPLLSIHLWLVSALVTNVLSYSFFFSGLPGSNSLNVLAFAWDIGSMLGCIYGLFLLGGIFDSDFKSSVYSIKNATLWSLRFQTLAASLREIIVLSAPLAATELSLVSAHFLMYWLLSLSSEASTLQAAWTVKLKLEEVFALLPLLALTMSTVVIVGHNVGAGRNDKALLACGHIVAWAVIGMLSIGAVFSMTSPVLSTLFSSDKSTQQAIVSFLSPSIIQFPLCAVSAVICAVLEGAGQTVGTMYVNMIFQLGFRIGFAYYFGMKGGAIDLFGVSFGLCVAQFLMVLSTILFFRIQLLKGLIFNN